MSGGGVRGCRGVVNEGVGWETGYEKRAQKDEDEGGRCGVM